MRNQMMWIRLLTATVLFVMMAKVNVWADRETHLVLAVGYRALLLLAPVFLFLGAGRAMQLSLLMSFMGGVWSFFSVNGFSMFLFALGMAVSGYLAKLISSQTSKGAADNKVSLNMGSLASGGLILLIAGRDHLLAVVLLCLGVAILFAARMDWSKWDHLFHRKTRRANQDPLQVRFVLGWALIGIATGVKLTGIFTVLPQYLLAKTGSLPSWFGVMVMINSVGVIAVQHFVIAWLDRRSLLTTFITSASAMLLLALPAVFHVEFMVMSALWISLLTLGECALSRYDRLAHGAGYLFTKELMVGVGSMFTVLLSRNHALDAMWSGIVGTGAFALGALLISSITAELASLRGLTRVWQTIRASS